MWVQERNGKFRYFDRVKNLSGELVTITVTLDKNSKQAQKKAEELLRIKALSIIKTVDSKLKFHDLINIYDREHCKNLKISSYKLYKTKLDKIIRNSKNILVKDIQTRYIIEILKTISVSDNSYNNYLKLIKSIFKHAYKEDYIDDIKIIDKLSYKKRKIKQKDKLFYELEELQEIIKDLEGNKMLQNVVEFLANSGLRIGELLALTEKDLKGDILNINKNKDQHGNITAPKTYSGSRKISLNKKCLDIWNDQIRINRNNKILKKKYRDNKVIFAKLDGEYNTYSNLRKSFEKNIGIFS